MRMYGFLKEPYLCNQYTTVYKVYSWDLCDNTYEFENKGRYKAPELLANSLTELLIRLSPVRKQFPEKDGENAN